MDDEFTDVDLIKISKLVVSNSKHVEYIDLSYQNMTEEEIVLYLQLDATRFSTLEKLDKITEIYLDNNKLRTGFIKLLNLFPICPIGPTNYITTLSLSNNYIDDDGAILLAGYIYMNNTLEYLDISENWISSEGAKELAKSLTKNKSLYEFNIGHNNISTEGANYIGEMLKLNKHIQILYIESNKITLFECETFYTSIKDNTTLTFLNMSGNDFAVNELTIDDENPNTILIRCIFGSKSIDNLFCKDCNIDDIAIHIIAHTLKENNTLTHLFISENQISNEGAHVLFDALKNNDVTVLKHIDMVNTHINDDCIDSFADMLGGNSTLQSVDFSYTDISNAGLIELSNNDSFNNNDSILILNIGENMLDIDITIDEDIITENPNINFILERNRNLYWHPYYYNTNLFNNGKHDSHKMIMATLLCNYYGTLNIRLPMLVLIYIFKFFNRKKFLSI